MRGFLSLEPDAATQARLTQAQNRLRDSLARQGVSFPDRLGIALFVWPFATFEELAEASRLLTNRPAPVLTLGGVQGFPNGDRPADVGVVVKGAEPVQSELFESLKGPLDPDPPKAILVRLARVSPPSRKVGAALRGTSLPDLDGQAFVAEAVAIWNQTPQGFEVYRRMRWGDGGS